MSSIFDFIRSGKRDEARLWIPSATDLNIRDQYGNTPLTKASAFGMPGLAISLILAGADVNLATSEGFTALHYSARDGTEELTRVLIENGAFLDVESISMPRLSPFSMSFNYCPRNARTLWLLASAGCFLDRTDNLKENIPDQTINLATQALEERKEIAIIFCAQEFPDTITDDVLEFIYHQQNLEFLAKCSISLEHELDFICHALDCY